MGYNFRELWDIFQYLGHIFGKQWDIFQIIYVIVMETSQPVLVMPFHVLYIYTCTCSYHVYVQYM